MLNASAQNKVFSLAGLMYANINVQSTAGRVLNATGCYFSSIPSPFVTSTRTQEVKCFAPVKKCLPPDTDKVYGYSAPAKSGVGIGVPVIIRAHSTRKACFFVPRSHTHSMVGCMGAEQSAPVSLIPGYANPVQSTTSEIGVSGGGYQNHESEAALCWLLPLPNPRNSSGLLPQFVVTVRLSAPQSTASLPQANRKPVVHWPGSTCSFLRAAYRYVGVNMRNSACFPLISGADLFGMVDHCEALCAELMECRDSTLQLALCGRLSHSLDVLKSQLDQPLPPHLIERLTVDSLPDSPLSFVPDSDLLCKYCLALVQALLSCALTPDTTQQLSGLLYELVGVLADDLKAPRFVREVRQ